MNRIYLTGIFVTALLVLGACTSAPLVWDESIPESQTAAVAFNSIKVTSYNGIAVEKWTQVIIPAGTAEIGADVTIYHAGVNFVATGMDFSCHLEPGQEYYITGASQNMLWGVRVYRGLKPGSEQIAFIPFRSQPTF